MRMCTYALASGSVSLCHRVVTVLLGMGGSGPGGPGMGGSGAGGLGDTVRGAGARLR